MKLLKLIALSVVLLGMMTNCKLDEQKIASGRPTTIYTGPTSPVSVGTSGTGTTTSTSGRTINGAAVSDALTDGTSVGTVGGGVFTSAGYQITSGSGYIMYDTEIQGNFGVEFDTSGLISGEYYQDPDDQATILFMQDAPIGTDWSQWRTLSSCLFQMIKLADYPGSDSTDYMKYKAGCNGGASGFEFRSDGPLSWNSSTTYHWTVTVQNGVTTAYRDGQLLFSASGFYPQDRMRFMFGGTGQPFGGFSPYNVTYSNILIYAF
ncbi:hypothetical protein U14_03528 [Candidatus Moduliflexus flocculans]|uniref:Uncharacterized protein n=1 Tax=Candidatus Moduliflexus flocculans TaxID=1499966 RepID=A0A081BPG1_9BACT|nr:hypothetical protein U14_03528 [Candidatus Moduliflexus flocculans]